jgi:hypothetical protein
MRMYTNTDRPLGSIVENRPYILYQFCNSRVLWRSLPLGLYFFGTFDQYCHWEKWRRKINLSARNWSPVSWFQFLRFAHYITKEQIRTEAFLLCVNLKSSGECQFIKNRQSY